MEVPTYVNRRMRYRVFILLAMNKGLLMTVPQWQTRRSGSYWASLRMGIGLMCLLCLSHCGAADTNPLENNAFRVRTSINNNNASAFADVVALPFYVREHTWESASDGIGFVLAAKKDSTALNKDQLTILAKSIVDKIQIEGETVIMEDISLAMFTKELFGMEHLWQGLTMALFVRGESDVEHVVLMGFDPLTNKLRALYFN